jgi:hypothetical protein
VLLVHDDRAELADGREDRRAGADGDAARALPQRTPRVVALAVGQRRMQDGHDVAELGTEPGHGLRRERDLRHEHDGAPALRCTTSRSSSM